MDIINIANCERKIENANLILSTIVDDRCSLFFNKTNLIKPNFENKELSFVRLVSWLYTLYFETGKVSLGIIRSAMDPQALEKMNSHKSIVQSLRTILQHNIDRNKGSREYKIEKDCMNWTKLACGKSIASTENEWMLCSKFLIDEAEKVLDSVVSTLDDMTNSDMKKNIFQTNWSITLESGFEPHLFDRVIENFILFIEIDNFDSVKYRNKNLASWRGYLSRLEPHADFTKEISRIVESTIVHDFLKLLPLTFDEICDLLFITKENFNEVYNHIQEISLTESFTRDMLIENIKVTFKNYLK